jgi:hypothetical protein
LAYVKLQLRNKNNITEEQFIIKNNKKSILDKLNTINDKPIITIQQYIDSIDTCNDKQNIYYTLKHLFEYSMKSTIEYVFKYNITIYNHLIHDTHTDIININKHKNTMDNGQISQLCPLYYNKETNKFYVYIYNHTTNENIWSNCSDDILIQIINKIIDSIFESLRIWENNNRKQILNSISMTNNYLNSFVKITKYNTLNCLHNITLKIH